MEAIRRFAGPSTRSCLPGRDPGRDARRLLSRNRRGRALTDVLAIREGTSLCVVKGSQHNEHHQLADILPQVNRTAPLVYLNGILPEPSLPIPNALETNAFGITLTRWRPSISPGMVYRMGGVFRHRESRNRSELALPENDPSDGRAENLEPHAMILRSLARMVVGSPEGVNRTSRHSAERWLHQYTGRNGLQAALRLRSRSRVTATTMMMPMRISWVALGIPA